MNGLCTYQFQLWEECNNNCAFCYLGRNREFTNDIQKKINIQKVLKTLLNDELYKKVNCIAYIGGEFFQGQLKSSDVKNEFYKLIRYTDNLLTSKKIKNCWISASLIDINQNDLYETLKLFSPNNIEKVWILTSFDCKWRFKTEQERLQWIKNLYLLRQTYPKIQINVTTIFTQYFIDMYLSGEYVYFFKLFNSLQCSFFLKTPCKIINGSNRFYTKAEISKILPGFFPTRASVLKFLNKFKDIEQPLAYDRLFSMGYRADYLELYGDRHAFTYRDRINEEEYITKKTEIDISHLKYIGDEVEFQHGITCNHSSEYTCYVDSDNCLICDKQFIKSF